jgi:GTPase SAR1 family protein
VYDVTHQASFENIRKWIQDVHTYAESNVNIVLIGNKNDLVDKKVVQSSQGEELAREYKIQFFETSAKTDQNVQQAFNALVQQVCDRLFSANDSTGGQGKGKAGAADSSKSVQLSGEQKEKSGCC